MVAVLLALGTAATAATLATGAPVFDYPDFSSPSGIKLNGDAQRVDGRLRLTPAAPDQVGSAFKRRRLLDSRRSFTTRFRVSLHDGSANPADGLAFLLIRGSKVTIGNGGGQLGYGGVGLNRSVAVEVDTFPNEGEPLADHFAVVVGGDPTNERASAVIPYPVSGHDTTVWITYKAKRKRLKVFGAETNDKPADPFISVRLNLKRQFDGRAVKPGRVRPGFTAATGADYQAHDIMSWKLSQPGR